MIVGSLVTFFRKLFSSKPAKLDTPIFDLTMTLSDGRTVPLRQFAGKKLLIVNTASRCGYTYQLQELQKLHETYGSEIQVLGFPSNDFWQETASDKSIEEFCQLNYGVTFPISKKISVVGKKADPLYRVLFTQTGKSPVWNFCKYLVDRDGKVDAFYDSTVKPLDNRIISKATRAVK